jgi:hypothetical protein
MLIETADFLYQLIPKPYNNMTVELYQQHMINRNGWATATEIQAAANLFGLNINIWLQQSSHCTLSSYYLLYFHLLINLANEKNSFHHLEHCNLKIDYCLHMLIETADFLYQLMPKPLNYLTSYHEKHHLQSHNLVYHPVQFEDWG